MKMIRWSGLIAFVIIVGLIAVFNLLFLDGIIKGIVRDQASLERAGVPQDRAARRRNTRRTPGSTPLRFKEVVTSVE